MIATTFGLHRSASSRPAIWPSSGASARRAPSVGRSGEIRDSRSLLVSSSSLEVHGDVTELVGVLLQPFACVRAPRHDRQVLLPGFGKRRFDQLAADAVAAKR